MLIIAHFRISSTPSTNATSAKSCKTWALKEVFSPAGESDDAMVSKAILVNGQSAWLGSNGCPNVVAGHSIIAGQYKDKQPDLVTSCNACVKQAHSMTCSLRVWPIKPSDIRFVGFCDSYFDFKRKGHQQGWLTGFTNKFLNWNKKAPISLAVWRSRRLPRTGGSPQPVETNAAS